MFIGLLLHYSYNHTDVPSSPQVLESRSRVLEYGTNYYSTVEVMWEHPGNESWIDFYHYLLFDGLTEVNTSVILESNTTNKTVIIDDYGMSILFVLSACNSSVKEQVLQ